MNALDQLFIRACKSKDPHTRVRSVYRRFYCLDEDALFAAITGVLAGICESNLKFTVGALITELHPLNAWKYGVDTKAWDYNYWEHCSNVLISRIRLSEVTKFEGLTSPLRFRNAA